MQRQEYQMTDQQDNKTIPSMKIGKVPCPQCNGTGKIVEIVDPTPERGGSEVSTKCWACGGTGVVNQGDIASLGLGRTEPIENVETDENTETPKTDESSEDEEEPQTLESTSINNIIKNIDMDDVQELENNDEHIPQEETQNTKTSQQLRSIKLDFELSKGSYECCVTDNGIEISVKDASSFYDKKIILTYEEFDKLHDTLKTIKERIKDID